MRFECDQGICKIRESLKLSNNIMLALRCDVWLGNAQLLFSLARSLGHIDTAPTHVDYVQYRIMIRARMLVVSFQLFDACLLSYSKTTEFDCSE
jgi:hypothetical protein